VRRIVSGVTASRALIEAAVARGADAIFVHHGLFWRGQDGRVTGWMKQRLALLLAHDINLFAYHLPLDAHPSWATTRSSGAAGLQAERPLRRAGPGLHRRRSDGERFAEPRAGRARASRRWAAR
jgi:putative NIF3 family GTP cyclohydrolase 1 type 2